MSATRENAPLDDTPAGTWPGLFVVGTGRCGSTLLRKLLRVHPDLHLPKETHWIPLLAEAFGDRPLTAAEFVGAANGVSMAKGKTALERILREEGLAADDLAATLERERGGGRANQVEWTRAFYRALAARHGKRLWGDKTPDYGLRMRQLSALFPGARFVHIARDGRDVALSMSRVKSFRVLAALRQSDWLSLAATPPGAWSDEAAARDLSAEDFFALWRERLERTRAEGRAVGPERCLEVRYEELLADPRGALTSIARHAGLPGPEDWIGGAASLVHADNLGRNRSDPDHVRLTSRYGDALCELGFAVG